MKRINTTLCCVVDKEAKKILMVLSKRGLGSGKYNFPGGKKLEDESFLECAIRETEEETGIHVINPKRVGVLEFVWPNEDKIIYNEVYFSNEYSKELKEETDECQAFWVGVDDIPFDKMWASDKVWVPQMLEKKTFHFEFTHQHKDEKNPVHRHISINISENKKLGR